MQIAAHREREREKELTGEEAFWSEAQSLFPHFLFLTQLSFKQCNIYILVHTVASQLVIIQLYVCVCEIREPSMQEQHKSLSLIGSYQLSAHSCRDPTQRLRELGTTEPRRRPRNTRRSRQRQRNAAEEKWISMRRRAD